MSKVPAGTVIEVEDRKYLERLIFGSNVPIDDDKFEYFARKSFLNSVEVLIRQGGKLMRL